MIPPIKPFDGYKWRWATLTPTEGLNEPPIFLGVLRVLHENLGSVPSSPEVINGLRRVEAETRDRVSTHLQLVRTQGRNILRNSGQYWKALGVLQETRGIALTDLGRQVATGAITRDEFASTVIRRLELPNTLIQKQAEVDLWRAANLRLKPLQLLLSLMVALSDALGTKNAYITPLELSKIIIPLAGDIRSTEAEYVDSILRFRNGSLDLTGWPDCTPEDNDQRMVREFLLFLAFYGLCVAGDGPNDDQHFSLLESSGQTLRTLLTASPLTLPLSAPIEPESVRGGAEIFAERDFIRRVVKARPNQISFRRDVLSAYRGSCAITGERITEVLEAAHIVPIEYCGTDAVQNGMCLRSDIHKLFDSGHLRVKADGEIWRSSAVRESRNYRSLPLRIDLPQFLSLEAVRWRWDYQ